jgi:hypothetical protein
MVNASILSASGCFFDAVAVCGKMAKAPIHLSNPARNNRSFCDLKRGYQ